MRLRSCLKVLLAVTLLVPMLVVIRASAKNEKVASGRPRINITSDYTKDKPSVPVRSLSDHPVTYIIRIPDNENGVNPNKASAIKVAPCLTEKGAVKIDVSLLFGDVTGITSFEQYKQLKQQPVASYYLRKGEKVTASALKKFGLLAIEFDIVLAPGEDKCSGCTCGKLCCTPNPGKCLGCGDCGTCCMSW